MDKFWYRNPQTLKLEVKEFAGSSTLGLERISDPILSQLAQGYSVMPQLVGNDLFTIVKTEKETGRFPAFGKEVFAILSDDVRGLYQPVKFTTEQDGYITTSLREHQDGFKVDRRELNDSAIGAEQLLAARQMRLSNRMALNRENNQAIAALTAAHYASGFSESGAAYGWGANTGDPIEKLRSKILSVQIANGGQRPNLVIFSPTSWELFINNSFVLDRIKYGGSPATPAQISEQAVAQVLRVEKVVVGYASGYQGAGGGIGQAAVSLGAIWDGAGGSSLPSSNVIIAISGRAGVPGIPAFGYTYERENSPIVESWFDMDEKVQKYSTEWFYDAYVTKNDAAFLAYSIA